MNDSRIGRERAFKIVPLCVLACACIMMLFAFSAGQKESFAEDTDLSALSNADCIKCHAKVAEMVESSGNKHKTEVGCMDCHNGHPPMVSKEKIIPACAECHAGTPHYEIGGCATCHSDPHAPLDMELTSNITGPCLSCHPQQGDELKGFPSRHTKLACTSCHAAHREVPPCMNCHKPHSEIMTNDDCQTCHPAHQPRTITYGTDMPSVQCSSCHTTIYGQISDGTSKHSTLACVYCHKEKHAYVPACEDCHGSPHPASMMAKFNKCGMCHMNAHTLGKEAKK